MAPGAGGKTRTGEKSAGLPGDNGKLTNLSHSTFLASKPLTKYLVRFAFTGSVGYPEISGVHDNFILDTMNSQKFSLHAFGSSVTIGDNFTFVRKFEFETIS